MNDTATIRLNAHQLSLIIEALQTEIDTARETLKQMPSVETATSDELDERAELNEYTVDLEVTQAQVRGALDTLH